MAISVLGSVGLLACSPTSAGNGTTSAAVTRGFVLYDATTVCSVADSGAAATAQISRQALGSGSFNAVTSTMACTAANAVARCTTIDVAQSTFVSTDVVRLTLAGGTAAAGAGTENGIVYATVRFT